MHNLSITSSVAEHAIIQEYTLIKNGICLFCLCAWEIN
ncbi:hypothetical protein OTSANNIE_1241 [Anaplasma phagocytophilum str. Annie]|nr:hypothetical protein APHNYW_0983 [Anaplasma phagocytophilum str. ApNYW]KJV98303.1 hypothetical protein OTSANNIE_1241 [Anaplasma phagocytophilum str. Annie]